MRGNDSQQFAEARKHGWCAVVVPCYNEAARLPTAEYLRFVVQEQGIRFVFVNDGSRDGTLQVLEAMRAGHEECIEVLNCTKNRGKGEAVRLGMKHALQEPDVEFVGFWDADLATPLDAIPRLAQVLMDNDRLQMVFGSRVRLLGRAIYRKEARHYLGRTFATAASVVLGLPIYDTQCGAKLFRVTPDLAAVLDKPFCSRWIFDVEIIARFIRRSGGDRAAVHDAIYEYPLEAWRDVAGSKVRATDFLRAFVDLMKIRRQYFA